MNLSCCICIFVLTHFVFGSLNEKSNEDSNINKLLHRKSDPDDSNPVAVDEPEANDEDSDADADEGGDGDIDVDADKDAEEEAEENAEEDAEEDAEVSRENAATGYSTDSSGSGESFSQSNVLPFWNGIVPYYIDSDSYDEIIVNRIVAVTKIIEKESCIQFVHIKDKDKVEKHGKYFLHIVNPDKKRECVHSATRGSEGEPTLILGYDCMQTRDIIHALMHLLGFGDEVTHPLRDSYIRVLWENIQPKYRYLFTIKKLKKYHEVGEYDMMSIMHFYPTAYSINGAPTVVPLTPGGFIMPSNKLSVLDKMKLRLAFKHECNRRKVSKLLGTCINAIQGDDTGGCISSSGIDNGGESLSKNKSSSGSDKIMNLIGSGEDKKESLIGTDSDKIEVLSGSDKDRIEVLSGTYKDKKKVVSGSDRDKIQAEQRKIEQKF